MKKIVLFAMVVFGILLSGCAKDSSSIGIIGGADGPTSVYVSK